jgi:CRP-like cAMP-binding protein
MRTDRRVDITERAIYLRSIPVAASLPPAVLHILAGCVREREFRKGEALMREGQPILALHLLTEGKLALTRGGRPIGKLEPPQSLGFLGILARSEGTYDAIAEVETRTLELHAETLYELAEDHFALLSATIRYAAERMYYEMQELPEEALSIAPQTIPLVIPDRPLDMVERIVFLRCIRIYSRSPLNSLAVLSQQLTEVRLPARTPLWSAGDPPKTALLVVSGDVQCATADGRRFRYGPGTIMGGIEGIAGKPRWYGAVTETPVVGLLGDPDELIDLFEDNFAMAMDFVGMMASGLIGLMERKAALGQQPLAVRRDVNDLGAVPVGA